MKADENSHILEKQLKTLGQKIRLDILKKLDLLDNPLSFSTLQKEVLGLDLHSVNFSFHLNALKRCGFISTSHEGYYLTNLGQKILQKILSIEQIIYEESNPILIRTSKYSKERFNIKNVEDYLMNEGELEQNLAKHIAREVEDRLSKANIEYLTAPLMREYINGILLENGLEEVRHKLTRLGTPPFEVFKLFGTGAISPDSFLKKLGSDVSEQFLLLNLLPKDLADLYLSGEIALLHLNYWSLRPLGIYLNAKTLLNLIYENCKEIPKKIQNLRDFLKLSNRLFEFLNRLKLYCSEDLFIGDFNRIFLSLVSSFNKKEDIPYVFDLISSQFFNFEEMNNKISLEFNYNVKNNLGNDFLTQYKIDKEFLEALINKSKFFENLRTPLILIDSSILKSLDLKGGRNYISNVISSNKSNNLIFYNNKSSNLINSTTINVQSLHNDNIICNRIILDKILINLHAIATASNQNDDKFIQILQERLESVFKLFKHKAKLVKQKLETNAFLNRVISKIPNFNAKDFFPNTLKSVSFFGLNHAVKHHCGIELDRIKTSESFALEILNVMKKLIEEKNTLDNGEYILTQPHKDSYLINSKISKGLSNNFNGYSSRLLRNGCKLSLGKQIQVFKKFENLLNGGCVFSRKINSDYRLIADTLNLLIESDLRAFSINKNI